VPLRYLCACLPVRAGSFPCRPRAVAAAGAGRLFPVSPTSGRRGAYGCSTPARPSDRFSLASPVLDLTLFWTPRTRIKSCWSCSVCCAIDQSKRSRGRIGVSDPLENMYVKTGRRQALRVHVSSSYRPAHAAAVNLPILHGLQSNGSGCVLLREWTAKSEMGDSVCLHFGVRVNVLPTALSCSAPTNNIDHQHRTFVPLLLLRSVFPTPRSSSSSFRAAAAGGHETAPLARGRRALQVAREIEHVANNIGSEAV
jgi:hypothetical protein